MSADTLYTFAVEMLNGTNPYNIELDTFYYQKDQITYRLLDILKSVLSDYRDGYRNRSKNNYRHSYQAIAQAMLEYLEHYPAPFSFKQQVKPVFSSWLSTIKEAYNLSDEEIPAALMICDEEIDTGVFMVKALHQRDGITKQDISESLHITMRAVQKDFRKLSPDLYEGETFEKNGVYVPFRLGGQALIPDIKVFDKKGDKRKYYSTPHTIHPIVLQENLKQIVTLLTSLCHSYYDYTSNESFMIALDIWYQLSDYAKNRVKYYHGKENENFLSFIAQLENSCPDDHLSGLCLVDVESHTTEMTVDDAIKYLMHTPKKTFTVIFKDAKDGKIAMSNQKFYHIYDGEGNEFYEAVSLDGTRCPFVAEDVADIIIE